MNDGYIVRVIINAPAGSSVEQGVDEQAAADKPGRSARRIDYTIKCMHDCANCPHGVKEENTPYYLCNLRKLRVTAKGRKSWAGGKQ